LFKSSLSDYKVVVDIVSGKVLSKISKVYSIIKVGTIIILNLFLKEITIFNCVPLNRHFINRIQQILKIKEALIWKHRFEQVTLRG
jgi:hypothetical protein